MTIQLILHCVDRKEVMYEGPPRDCPPIPQVGAQIECDAKLYRLEGVRYVYTEGRVTIHLLA